MIGIALNQPKFSSPRLPNGEINGTNLHELGNYPIMNGGDLNYFLDLL
jgi:hypothetical protein